VGFLNTVAGIVLFYAGSLTAIPYPIYTTAAYIAVGTFSYFLNRSFTFRSANPIGQSLGKFFALFGINLVLTQILQFLLIERAGAATPVGLMAGMIFYTLFGYVGSRMIVFKRGKGA
jgi:putative flippase GtrA